MARMTHFLPQGRLPTSSQFWRAFLEKHSPNHPLRFRNDSRLKNCDLSREEYWNEIRSARRESSEASLEWCAEQLRSMNIEWR
jgi:hypothetical protein